VIYGSIRGKGVLTVFKLAALRGKDVERQRSRSSIYILDRRVNILFLAIAR
jgi:hypothetical protein